MLQIKRWAAIGSPVKYHILYVNRQVEAGELMKFSKRFDRSSKMRDGGEKRPSQNGLNRDAQIGGTHRNCNNHPDSRALRRP